MPRLRSSINIRIVLVFARSKPIRACDIIWLPEDLCGVHTLSNMETIVRRDQKPRTAQERSDRIEVFLDSSTVNGKTVMLNFVVILL